MNDKKALKIFDECMDELYKASIPPITWKEIQNKYADQERSEFYMKHCIDEKLYDKITKKYKSKLNIYYNRQLSWFLLDYAPTFCKEL